MPPSVCESHILKRPLQFATMHCRLATVVSQKYSNHCPVQSTFHEMEHNLRINLDELRRNPSFSNTV